MVRALYRLIPLLIFALGIGQLAGQTDNRLRLLSAETLENRKRDGEDLQELVGSVTFQKGEMILGTDRAVYYRKLDRTDLTGSVRMTRPEEVLTCDSLNFYNARDQLHAWGNVRFVQKNQTVTCQELLYWTEIDSGVAVGDVVMTQDTRQLTSDVFKYKKVPGGTRGASFHALGSVVIDEAAERQIHSQTMTYNDRTGIARLEGDAAVREKDRDIRGNRITLTYSGEDLERAFAEGNAEATAVIRALASPRDRRIREYTDVLTSRAMLALFQNKKVKTLKLQGMASTVYHVVEDSVLQGVNEATGDTLTMSFDGAGDMVRIQVKGGARGRFIPEKGNTDVDTVVVYRADYLDYDIPNEITYMERDARVDYQDTGLAAGYIRITWKDNLLRARGSDGGLPTLYQTGREPMSGDQMEYDLLSEKGRVIHGKTRLDNGYYHGEVIHRYPESVFYVNESLYTTCDLEAPHFYFAAKQMKMIQGDKIIARPVILHIQDVPIMGLPFIVFPNKAGRRRSGWIMPGYGDDKRRGQYLQGLGYYWAFNDYSDALASLDFYDKAGILTRGRLRYNRRYAFNGYLQGSLNKYDLPDKDIAKLLSPAGRLRWDMAWNHRQTIDPTQQFNVNARYSSSSSYYREAGLDRDTRLRQQIISQANYSKRWPSSGNSMSIALQEKYDLQAVDRLQEPPTAVGQRIEEKTRTLPNISFRHNRSPVVKLNKGASTHWYHKIFWDLQSNLNNRQSLFWEADSAGEDSLYWPEQQKTLNRSWITHGVSISGQQRILRYLNVTPSLQITEGWSPSYREAELDADGAFKKEDGKIVYREFDRFKARHTGNVSVSLNTKVYGLVPFNVGRLRALRHVMTPSASYQFAPDFSKPVLGIDWGYFQRDVNGELFDRFSGSPISSTSTTRSQSIALTVQNLFQTKSEIEGKEVKQDILTWNMRTRYDLLADSLKLAPIHSSFRSKLGNRLALDFSMVHDIYRWNANTQTRLNDVLSVPRLVRMDASTELRIAGDRFRPLSGTPLEESKADTVQPDDTLGIDTEDDLLPLFRRQMQKPAIKEGKLWEARFSLRYSFLPTLDPDKREDFWLNSNITAKVGPGWRLKYSARFDLLEQQLVSHDFQLYRKLHCWEFSFNWTPSGPGQGYFLRINVIDADLRDIKYESRGGTQSFLGL